MKQFNDYQKKARELDIYPTNKEGILAHVLGLGNEAGEVCANISEHELLIFKEKKDDKTSNNNK